jgi:CheY-like chemotaxis protein
VNSVSSKPLFKDSLIRSIQNILLQREKAAEDGQNTASAEDQPAHPLEGCRILVVEDMELNAEILMDLLEMEKMQAEHAENGQLAVDMFAGHPAGYYDAVLMDVRMPVMNGLEATRAIRALNRPDAKTIPIIALTAYAFDEDVQRSLQAGMNAHLSKPVEPERLYETLRRLIAAAEQGNHHENASGADSKEEQNDLH